VKDLVDCLEIEHPGKVVFRARSPRGSAARHAAPMCLDARFAEGVCVEGRPGGDAAAADENHPDRCEVESTTRYPG
jgi:hypothetical protein